MPKKISAQDLARVWEEKKEDFTKRLDERLVAEMEARKYPREFIDAALNRTVAGKMAQLASDEVRILDHDIDNKRTKVEGRGWMRDQDVDRMFSMKAYNSKVELFKDLFDMDREEAIDALAEYSEEEFWEEFVELRDLLDT